VDAVEHVVNSNRSNKIIIEENINNSRDYNNEDNGDIDEFAVKDRVISMLNVSKDGREIFAPFSGEIVCVKGNGIYDILFDDSDLLEVDINKEKTILENKHHLMITRSITKKDKKY
jgi:hypothetical protein